MPTLKNWLHLSVMVLLNVAMPIVRAILWQPIQNGAKPVNNGKIVLPIGLITLNPSHYLTVQYSLILVVCGVKRNGQNNLMALSSVEHEIALAS